MFAEQAFAIRVDAGEIVPESFDSVARLARCVRSSKRLLTSRADGAYIPLGVLHGTVRLQTSTWER
jgi:hypothetical protein